MTYGVVVTLLALAACAVIADCIRAYRWSRDEGMQALDRGGRPNGLAVQDHVGDALHSSGDML